MLRYQNYIEDLNMITGYLARRDKEGFTERGSVDFLLVQAAELSCKALNNILIEDEFWEWVKNKEGEPIEGIITPPVFESIVLPVNARLLRELGYEGPPSPEELIRMSKNSLDNALFTQTPGNEVRKKIEHLTDFICSNAGKARGVLGAFDAGVYGNLSEKKDSRLYHQLKKKIPVRRILVGIRDAVAVIAGVVTIAAYNPKEQKDSTALPPTEEKVIIEKKIPAPPENDQHIIVDNYWWQYYQNLHTDSDSSDNDSQNSPEKLE